MPLYDLLAIVRAGAPRPAVAEVLRRAAVAVLDAGGVVTDVKSFGTRPLAYEIKRAGELHTQGQYVQLSFATHPKTLAWLQHDLKTDERVVRYLLVKNRALPPLPKLKEMRRLEAEIASPGAAPPLPLPPAAQAASAPPAAAAARRRGRQQPNQTQ